MLVLHNRIPKSVDLEKPNIKLVISIIQNRIIRFWCTNDDTIETFIHFIIFINLNSGCMVCIKCGIQPYNFGVLVTEQHPFRNLVANNL